MEILTSYSKSELEKIIEQSVRRCLNDAPAPQPVIDAIGIDEAMELTNYSRATIYKLSFAGQIPCQKFGKRLVFSRQELMDWMTGRMVRKQSPVEVAVAHLQAEVEKR